MCLNLIFIFTTLFLSPLSASDHSEVSPSESSRFVIQQIPPFSPIRISELNERSIPRLVLPVADPLMRPKSQRPIFPISKLMQVGVGMWGFGNAFPYVYRLITEGLASSATLVRDEILQSPGMIFKALGASICVAGVTWYFPRQYEKDIIGIERYSDVIASATNALQRNEQDIMGQLNVVNRTSLLALHRASYSVGALCHFYEHYLPALKIIESHKEFLDSAMHNGRDTHAKLHEGQRKSEQEINELRLSLDVLKMRMDSHETTSRSFFQRLSNPISPRPDKRSLSPSRPSGVSESSSSSSSSSIASTAVSTLRSAFEPARAPGDQGRRRSLSISIQAPLQPSVEQALAVAPVSNTDSTSGHSQEAEH